MVGISEHYIGLVIALNSLYWYEWRAASFVYNGPRCKNLGFVDHMQFFVIYACFVYNPLKNVKTILSWGPSTSRSQATFNPWAIDCRLLEMETMLGLTGSNMSLLCWYIRTCLSSTKWTLSLKVLWLPWPERTWFSVTCSKNSPKLIL